MTCAIAFSQIGLRLDDTNDQSLPGTNSHEMLPEERTSNNLRLALKEATRQRSR